MLYSYFKIALRNLRRNKVYTLINVLGLAIGLACCFLMLLFVEHELSYDKHHQHANDIYRFTYTGPIDSYISQVPPILGVTVAPAIPEMAAVARMYGRSANVVYTDPESGARKAFNEDRVYFADSLLTDILSFEVVRGNPADVMRKPNGVMLSEEMASKYFAEANPMGQTIYVQGVPFEVVAVAKDFPPNTHMHFNLIMPYDNMYELEGEQGAQFARQNLGQNWVISHSHTYVRLTPGASVTAVNEKIAEVVGKAIPESMQANQKFELQAVKDIHLYSADISLQTEPQGDITNVYIFTVIAIITLVIACINFINLSTAQSLKRAREIGMRKVMGAGKPQLFGQFLGESLVVSGLALCIALVVLNYLLPVLNNLTDRQLGMELLNRPMIIAGLATIYLITALAAGGYPALYITRFKVIPILKGMASDGIPRRIKPRKIMVVVQFTASVALISSAVIIFHQLSFLRNRSLGFDKERVITLPLFTQNLNNLFGGMDSTLLATTKAFENELLKNANIKGATLSSYLPGLGTVRRGVTYQGKEDPESLTYYPVVSVDYDFVDLYGLKIIAGRNFEAGSEADRTNAFLINEEAVKTFNFNTPEEALGKSITLEGKKGQVIGVLRDFNMLPLNLAMAPLIVDVAPVFFTAFSIKVGPGDLQSSLQQVDAVWQQFFPDKAFDYVFLDDQLVTIYDAQDRLGRIISYFAFLAIFISCLGSYGLIMYTARQRTKEIGVRKVLGASTRRIIGLLFREFTILYGIGFGISIPLSIWFTSTWLENFNYRISPQVWHFALSGAVTLVIVWGAISYVALRSALMNPSRALRTE